MEFLKSLLDDYKKAVDDLLKAVGLKAEVQKSPVSLQTTAPPRQVNAVVRVIRRATP